MTSKNESFEVVNSTDLLDAHSSRQRVMMSSNVKSTTIRWTLQNLQQIIATDHKRLTCEPHELPYTRQVHVTAKIHPVTGVSDDCIVSFCLANTSDKDVTLVTRISGYSLKDHETKHLFDIPRTRVTIGGNAEYKTHIHAPVSLKSMLVSDDELYDLTIKLHEFCVDREAVQSPETRVDGNMSLALAKMFEDETLKDVTFFVGNEKLMAHKSLIVARCEYFERMLMLHDTQEKRTGEVTITDAPMTVFRAFVKYLYTNRIDTIKELADELLMLADKYDVGCLKDTCERHLCDNLDRDNAIFYLIRADLCSCATLKRLALFTVKSNLKAMLASGEFEQLHAYPMLMQNILELFANDVAKV